MTPSHKTSQLCPNCRRLISRDEPSCPYCGIKSPGSWWKNNALLHPLQTPELFLTWLSGLNVALFVLSIILNPGGTSMGMNPFGFLSPDNRSLLLLGATGTMPIEALHRWWSLVSASYLHGSLLHLIFNLIALRQIGPLVIQEYGLARMFTIYTLGGIGGFLLSFLAGVPFTIGASAAVCALIGAALYYGKSRGGSYGQQVYQQIGGWAMSIFVFGLLVPGINNWAHGGGMAAGALCGLLLGYQENRREMLSHRLLGAACAGGTILILLWAVATAVIYRFS
ncbi:MAG: rhomboid family intramembrane serine protease [Deltaproteobacteria bacterium]|nr:rhomboid family intramembrane serine protease [Deltaproteobacteria bacterium]